MVYSIPQQMSSGFGLDGIFVFVIKPCSSQDTNNGASPPLLKIQIFYNRVKIETPLVGFSSVVFGWGQMISHL
jgi:hypothetical protein